MTREMFHEFNCEETDDSIKMQDLLNFFEKYGLPYSARLYPMRDGILKVQWEEVQEDD